MAGETTKTEAVCLDIRPWSRTSHIVRWMTPDGPVTTVVKGAVRPKSAFLGQYDLNYTCEIVYYSRAKGELHALRECSPLSTRDSLRSSYRALVLAEYMRSQTAALAPHGEESAAWFRVLADALDALAEGAAHSPRDLVAALLGFELVVLGNRGRIWLVFVARRAPDADIERRRPMHKRPRKRKKYADSSRRGKGNWCILCIPPGFCPGSEAYGSQDDF